nr:MAG TPA: hypothetical protein [Caudoviricetes sp.]
MKRLWSPKRIKCKVKFTLVRNCIDNLCTLCYNAIRGREIGKRERERIRDEGE